MKRQRLCNEIILSDYTKLNFPHNNAQLYLTNISMEELCHKLKRCILSTDDINMDTVYPDNIHFYNMINPSTYIMLPFSLINNVTIEALKVNNLSLYIHFEWKEKPENVYLMIK